MILSGMIIINKDTTKRKNSPDIFCRLWLAKRKLDLKAGVGGWIWPKGQIQKQATLARGQNIPPDSHMTSCNVR